jgi:succinoglycan biosynthesis protein ExoO
VGEPGSSAPVPESTLDATVVVPTFEAQATLMRALRSALTQSMPNLEVIVVDDASTDGSWNVIELMAFQDARVRPVRNTTNQGKSFGMNKAIAMARGRWLAVLDADDWYHPERLAALIGIGERWGADMVADNQFLFDAIANQTVGTAWSPSEGEWELSFEGFLDGSNAFESFNLGMLKPIIRTDFLQTKGLGYNERARDGHDFLHLLEFYLAGGRTVIKDSPYYYYTQPFGALSHQWSHPARKRYDFQTLQSISECLASAAADRLTPSQASSLDRRNAELLLLEQYHRLKESLAERNFPEALQRVAGHPEVLAFGASRVGRRLFKPAGVSSVERIAERSRSRGTDQNSQKRGVMESARARRH